MRVYIPVLVAGKKEFYCNSRGEGLEFLYVERIGRIRLDPDKDTRKK